MDTSDWISLLSAATALIAVIVGPIITLRVSRRQIEATVETSNRQIKASVVSSNRQDWINTLRDTISTFQATAVLLGLRQFNSDLSDTEQHDQMSRASTLRNKLHLLINPEEPDHARLSELADQIMVGVGPLAQKDGKPVGELQREMTQLAQQILKREWERVKRGD